MLNLLNSLPLNDDDDVIQTERAEATFYDYIWARGRARGHTNNRTHTYKWLLQQNMRRSDCFFFVVVVLFSVEVKYKKPNQKKENKNEWIKLVFDFPMRIHLFFFFIHTTLAMIDNYFDIQYY